MRRISVAITIALVLTATVAHAYVPPFALILEEMTKRFDSAEVKSLEASLRTTLTADGKPVEAGEVLRLATGERLHSQLNLPTGRRTVTVAQERLHSTGATLAVEAEVPAELALLLAPLDSRSAKRWTRQLAAWGIDTAAVSLSRMDQTIVYVVGARPWEKDRPQLWIDKQHLRPVRLYLPGSKGRESLEIRLTDYGTPGIGTFLPKQIEVRRGGDMVRRSIAEQGKNLTTVLGKW